MKKYSAAENFFGSVFCFVIAGLIYNYVDSGIWRNIGIGFFVIGGFGPIYDIFDKSKSKSYDPPPGYFYTQAIKQYFKDSKQANEDFEYANKKVLICPKCNQSEKILNLNNRKSSMIMMYNQGMPRVRTSDGQHIYPMICFRCKTITEFANDDGNVSGKAIEGIEYFKTKKITKKEKLKALKEAKMQNLKFFVEKLNKLK